MPRVCQAVASRIVFGFRRSHVDFQRVQIKADFERCLEHDIIASLPRYFIKAIWNSL